jgi:hypothetical protein
VQVWRSFACITETTLQLAFKSDFLDALAAKEDAQRQLEEAQRQLDTFKNQVQSHIRRPVWICAKTTTFALHYISLHYALIYHGVRILVNMIMILRVYMRMARKYNP